MITNREKLLQAFDAVSPGLATRELLEQSSCFVFKNGRVMTFNDEIACSIASPIADIEGAVIAKPLMELLSKLPEDEIDVSASNGKLRIKGKGRRAEIIMEEEIGLPIDGVELPGDWVKLEAEFLDALSIVQAVAATNKDANFNLTCVHFHPEWLEACDNFQAARFPIRTGVAGSCLARQAAIRFVPSLGMTEISETPSWIHFRNAAGLVMSCRRWQEIYENLDPIFDCSGDALVLPGGLADAVDKAKIFTSENTSSDHIFVRLRDGKMVIRGEGTYGKFEEQRSVVFSGDVSFLIAPKLLVEITKRANECVVGQGRLKIETGKFTYVSCLGAVE